MKFVYEYRSKDGIQHKGVVSASNREAAFSALKAKGMKPGRLYEAKGFFNKFLGKGKRWTAIVILGAIAAAFALLWWLTKEKVDQADFRSHYAERSHIYGDPGLLQMCNAQGWTNVFAKDPGALFLAWYAQPGVDVQIRGGEGWKANAVAALTSSCGIVRWQSSEPEEVKKMKRIVNGMKRELMQYVADGGTVTKYVDRVIERQRLEVQILMRMREELGLLQKNWLTADAQEREKIAARWKKKNEVLREMGMETMPMPEDWELKIFENTPLQDSEK